MNRTALERRVHDHLGDAFAAEQRRTRDELVAYGLLLPDGASWLGTAVLVRVADPDIARAVLTAGRHADIEVHDWQFGGRHDRFRTSVVIRSVDAARLSGGPGFSR